MHLVPCALCMLPGTGGAADASTRCDRAACVLVHASCSLCSKTLFQVRSQPRAAITAIRSCTVCTPAGAYVHAHCHWQCQRGTPDACTPASSASRCVRITLRGAPSAVAVVLMQRAALGAFAPMAIVQGPAMALLAAVTRCANVLYSSSALSHMDAARLSALIQHRFAIGSLPVSRWRHVPAGATLCSFASFLAGSLAARCALIQISMIQAQRLKNDHLVQESEDLCASQAERSAVGLPTGPVTISTARHLAHRCNFGQGTARLPRARHAKPIKAHTLHFLLTLDFLQHHRRCVRPACLVLVPFE